MSKKILVIGSTNTDMVIKTEKFPAPGETVIGGKFLMNPGGKGANQAVAASRLGGQVTFITKTGNDIFGKQAIQQFEKEGINTEFILSDKDNPSGMALITVDKNGENSIVVASGSNSTLSPFDLNIASEEFTKAEVILLQLEIPLNTVSFAAKLGNELGKKVILNPAPAMVLTNELINDLFIITPNKTEAELLTGINIKDNLSVEKAAEILKSKGAKNVIITLGPVGAFVFTDDYKGIISSPKVQAVDTTAAGDVFNGALAVALSEGKPIVKAVEFANQAAAISVTKMGAQSSAPFRKELTSMNLDTVDNF